MEFVDDNDLEESEDQCCICYQPIAQHVPKCGRLQPCNHQMHGECILQWMVKRRVSRRTPRCPICRSWIELCECNQPSPISYKHFGCVSLERYKFETIAQHLYATSIQTKGQDDRYILSIRNTLIPKQVSNTDNVSVDSYEAVSTVDSSEGYSTGRVDWDAFFLRGSLRRSSRAFAAPTCVLL